MTTATELKDLILSKAEEDSDFRARLIADPRAAIASEVGADVPIGFDIVVHEDNATTAHLVLPPPAKLTEAELATAAGGHHTGLWG